MLWASRPHGTEIRAGQDPRRIGRVDVSWLPPVPPEEVINDPLGRMVIVLVLNRLPPRVPERLIRSEARPKLVRRGQQENLEVMLEAVNPEPLPNRVRKPEARRARSKALQQQSFEFLERRVRVPRASVPSHGVEVGQRDDPIAWPISKMVSCPARNHVETSILAALRMEANPDTSALPVLDELPKKRRQPSPVGGPFDIHKDLQGSVSSSSERCRRVRASPPISATISRSALLSPGRMNCAAPPSLRITAISSRAKFDRK